MRKLTLDKLPGRVLSRLDLETAFVASRCVIALSPSLRRCPSGQSRELATARGGGAGGPWVSASERREQEEAALVSTTEAPARGRGPHFTRAA